MSSPSRRTRVSAFVLLAGAISFAGGTRAETIRVQVKGLAFLPPKISAHVGDTIEWANEDFVAHTATARNGAWDVQLPANATGRTEELKNVGTVEYYCRYHPNMKGEITVTAK